MSNLCQRLTPFAQLLARSYAKTFNELGLQRQLQFLPVGVFKLSERGGALVNIEPMLEGDYVKHNDNDGHVDTNDMYPQAFSHYTWEASGKKLLICDIQGVGDYYTDPQIHSIDGEGFGSGNMGPEGIRRFFLTHK
ncbi:hypothetical protein GUITHDRAFT_70870 [Guillardia theta CCMP2712]|uniref:Alpha-type protein kinase domain-containing protein n=1 Tax=Guillardia theta (strain CCMP2712) TaxID=905079 RepID=L1JDC2_GUITC|nr:hypothetical protein GUITHDRAFT_70870 [Guillardia theta CCMP2712]EKX46110.1 hypothetical protein GUITHDRAFT_70870 [Guillardia theta CCMP2712]|eukprot:XP_005833090.1 hypothetical protein GUITHDRAFT_70870 [Guillardia theta CCMP2712]